jgi:hypothetical protein
MFSATVSSFESHNVHASYPTTIPISTVVGTDEHVVSTVFRYVATIGSRVIAPVAAVIKSNMRSFLTSIPDTPSQNKNVADKSVVTYSGGCSAVFPSVY